MTTEAPERFELRSGESWREPWPAYARLRDGGPAHHVVHSDLGPYWVLPRFADVLAAVRDTVTFSSAQGLTPGTDAESLFDDNARPIVMMDPPDHTAMRRLVSKPMTPRRVAVIEDAVRAFVDDHLDRVEDAGEVDIIEALFKPLPSYIVGHYLGVPADERTRFDGWTAAIVAATASEDYEEAADAFAELFAYSEVLMDRRRSDPGDDLVSAILEAGEDLASPGWIVGFVFTMVTGGNDTTTGLLGGAAELLTAHRDQRKLLVSDPGRIPGAVEEFLRLTTPVQNLARTTTRPVEVGEVAIPEGDKVLLLYGSANRDEREFGPDAGELDVTRDIDRTVSFGYGAHHCLGAAAARLQATVALEQLLDRFPDFEVDAAAGRFAPGSFVRRYESLPFTGGR